jgi:hypothetical protein
VTGVDPLEWSVADLDVDANLAAVADRVTALPDHVEVACFRSTRSREVSE